MILGQLAQLVRVFARHARGQWFESTIAHMFIKKFFYIFFYCFVFIFFSFLYSYDRIVSLSPNVTENIFDMNSGDLLVGVTSFCKIENKYKDRIKVIGGIINPNYEAVMLLKPDLICASLEDQNVEIINQLRKISKVVLFKENKSFEDIKDNYFYLAKILNKESLAKEKIEIIENKLKLKTFHKNVSFYKKKVFFIIQNSPIVTAGRDTFLNDILNYLGLENVVERKVPRYPVYSLEELLVKNPDIFIHLTNDTKDNNFKFFKSCYNLFLDPDIFTRATPNNFLKSVEILYDEIKKNNN